MKRYRNRTTRRAVAATEMAILAPFILGLLLGLWEVGRYTMVQNILDGAAREGARLGSSGTYFSSNNHNDPKVSGATLTLNPPATNGDYEVQKKIDLFLTQAGIPTTGMTVTVANVGTTSAAKTWSYTYVKGGTSTGSGYDPTAAADQLDQINVTINVPYSNVAWSPLSYYVGQSTTMSGTATWYSMRDIPLSISTTIPSQPLQPTDALP
jgi:Flp pilus assembly protein TadG